MTESTVNALVVHKWYARPVFFVADLEASLRFYIGKLGFTKKWHKVTVCQVDHGECEIILCQSDKRQDKSQLVRGADQGWGGRSAPADRRTLGAVRSNLVGL